MQRRTLMFDASSLAHIYTPTTPLTRLGSGIGGLRRLYNVPHSAPVISASTLTGQWAHGDSGWKPPGARWRML
jgi:hypothetical protein